MSGTYQYVVRSGDTCNALGINAASASSQGVNCQNLQVGQQVWWLILNLTEL